MIHKICVNLHSYSLSFSSDQEIDMDVCASCFKKMMPFILA
jgi:hypothetical protein